MTRNERLAEIRARLEAATPGPWSAEDCEDGHRVWMLRSDERRSNYESHHLWECNHSIYPDEGSQRDEADANADFIAHAPEDIAYLLTLLGEVA